MVGANRLQVLSTPTMVMTKNKRKKNGLIHDIWVRIQHDIQYKHSLNIDLYSKTVGDVRRFMIQSKCSLILVEIIMD